MKKYFLLCTLIGAVLLGFTACGDDDDEPQLTPAELMAGTYAGVDNVNVGGQWSYQASNSPKYTITANADGTINITIPVRQYDNTQVGNIVAGTYTIKNIAWDATANAWVRDYHSDGIKGHVTISGDRMKMDGDYDLNDARCKVAIAKDAQGNITVSNAAVYGKMPFALTFTFVGK